MDVNTRKSRDSEDSSRRFLMIVTMQGYSFGLRKLRRVYDNSITLGVINDKRFYSSLPPFYLNKKGVTFSGISFS